MILSSDLFFWHKDQKNLSVDFSDLNPVPVDNRFGIKSERTGKVEYFVYDKQVRCGTVDNEVIAFEFLPENKDCGVNKLIIWND